MSELLKERTLLILALVLCVIVSLLGVWDAPELSPARMVYAVSTSDTQSRATTVSGSQSVSAVTAESAQGSVVPTAATTPAAIKTTTASSAVGGKVNINTATKEQLADALDGIGDTLAQRIVEYRESHGGFDSIEEIMNVSGIGEKRYAAIKDHITIG